MTNRNKHVSESKNADGTINLPLAAAHLLEGVATVLDGSNKLHATHQYGPGGVTFTVPDGQVARVLISDK